MKKQVFNPYLPEWEYIPDGEPRVFGERLYVFGSHDRFNGEKYCQNDYVCWSAPVGDLSCWGYDGVIYRAVQDPHNPEGNMRLFAPEVVQGSDGGYYLYYGLSSRNAVSVARCGVPNGNYEFLSDVRYPDGTVLGEKPGDRLQFDPGVLVDGDGTVFLYTGFSPGEELLGIMKQTLGPRIAGEGGTVAELEQDMKTVKTPPAPLIPGWQNALGTSFEGHEFFEASSIRKFGGTYYFIYSSVLSHELCYATSNYPDRDFRYRGILHSNGDIGIAASGEAKNFWGNNHGSIAHINGAYYIFGHRQTNAHEFSRQGVAEKLVEAGDGGFMQAEMTSCGLNGGPLTGAGTYSAGIACNLKSASGVCRTTDASKEKHPFITQDG
ncbi:MAG: family 43 glycosylhydrolase, partial [Treponema sp.]|nr:family 43 glycosylhydrolase [Treponema sp.]